MRQNTPDFAGIFQKIELRNQALLSYLWLSCCVFNHIHYTDMTRHLSLRYLCAQSELFLKCAVYLLM